MKLHLPIWLLLLAVVQASILGEIVDETKYWKSILHKINDFSQISGENLTWENLDEREEINTEVIQKLKTDPSFAFLVRQSLRNDERTWVRTFSAGMLVKAFVNTNTSDSIYMLSDPDVRGFGIASICVYRIDDAICSLPAGLLSTNANQRSSALRGIRSLMGWKGLPYFSVLLYDSDVDVASEAADGLAICKNEDAVPHLYRYLKQCGQKENKKITIKRAILALHTLYQEAAPENLVLTKAVSQWLERLERDIKSSGSPVGAK